MRVVNSSWIRIEPIDKSRNGVERGRELRNRDMKRIDGSRKRCLGCGHPKAEHHGPGGCTVPKCVCALYLGPVLEESSDPGKRGPAKGR